MKCIIYGIGPGRLRVEKYLKSGHEIIGYSDSFYDKDTFNNKKYYKPSELQNIHFDYIVIAIGDIAISSEIENNLVNYGIKSEKIIDFYII